MPYLLFSLKWMSINVLLAVLPVVLAFSLIQIRNKTVKAAVFILWLLFLPNTIYLLTDIKHIPKVLILSSGLEEFIVLSLFALLVLIGLVTYVLAIYPLERSIKRSNEMRYSLLLCINFFVGIGMILGRVFRFNSWEIFTQPLRIIATTLFILSSTYYVTYIILISIACTIFYICFIPVLKKLSSPASHKKLRHK